jgi:hypothetical protein
VQCEGELREAVVVNVKAKRIFHRASSLKLDAAGYPIKDKENASIDSFLNRPANRETPMAADESQAEVSAHERFFASLRQNLVNDVISA